MNRERHARRGATARSAVPVVVTAVAVFASLVAFDRPAGAHNPALSKSYEYTVGDAIAARMQGMLRIVAGLETSTLVYYDRENRNVVAEIIGGTDDVEGAKREIGAFVEAIRENLMPYAKKQHRLDLTDQDVTLIYYNATDEGVPVEIVRRENGAFVVPKPNEGGENGGAEG